MKKPKAYLIDHDDSFTENLRWWLSIAFDVCVLSWRDLEQAQTNDGLIVLSAGPKSPHDYPQTLSWLKESSNKKILGICLGFQMMGLVSGGDIQSYSPVVHGKTSQLTFLHNQKIDIQVARYHSLKCQNLINFRTIAISKDDNVAMWAEHHDYKWLGWQFHPESFLTIDHGFLLDYLKNWINK